MKRMLIGTVVLTLAGFVLATAPVEVAAVQEAEYAIVIKKTEVKTTNKDGSAWDINDGKPDLAVSVRNTSDKDSKAFRTKDKTDTYSAVFDEVSTVKVKEGQALEFIVLDKDVAADDECGKHTHTIDAKVLREGKLRMENFDQVIYLEIEFKKL